VGARRSEGREGGREGGGEGCLHRKKCACTVCSWGATRRGRREGVELRIKIK